MTNLLFKKGGNTLNREVDISTTETPTLAFNNDGVKVSMAREDMLNISEVSITNRIPVFKLAQENINTSLQAQVDTLEPQIEMALSSSVKKQTGVDNGIIELSRTSDSEVTISLNCIIYNGTAFNQYSQTINWNLSSLPEGTPTTCTVYLYFDGTEVSGYSFKLPVPTVGFNLIGSFYQINSVIQEGSVVATPFNTVTSRDTRLDGSSQITGATMTSNGSTNLNISEFIYGYEGINWNENFFDPNRAIFPATPEGTLNEWTRMYPSYTSGTITTGLIDKWFTPTESGGYLQDTQPSNFYIWIPCIAPSGQLLFLAPQEQYGDKQQATDAITNAVYDMTGVSSRITFFGFCFICEGKSPTSEWQAIGQLPTQLYSLPASALGPQAVISGINIVLESSTITDASSIGFLGFHSSASSTPYIYNTNSLKQTSIFDTIASISLDINKFNDIMVNGSTQLNITSITGGSSGASVEGAFRVTQTSGNSSIHCVVSLPSGYEFAAGVDNIVDYGGPKDFYIFNGIVYGPLKALSTLPVVVQGLWQYSSLNSISTKYQNLQKGATVNIGRDLNIKQWLPDDSLYEIMLISSVLKVSLETSMGLTVIDGSNVSNVGEVSATDGGWRSNLIIQLRRNWTLQGTILAQTGSNTDVSYGFQCIAYKKVAD